MKIPLTIFSVIMLFGISPVFAYSIEENQFHVSTKMHFPKTIKPQEIKDFSITIINVKSVLYVQNLTATFDISPKSASQYVHIEAKPIEKLLWAGSGDTIHGIIQIDNDIPVEKIFIAVSFKGIGSHDISVFSTSQTDTTWITVEHNNTSRTSGGSFSPDKTVYPVPWETKYPLKQIKSGVALVDIKCNEGKYPVVRYDRMRVACVSLDTESTLVMRGWATMRLAMPGDNISEALCNNYGGKWQQDHNGCRDISDLQCSLIGGKFVDDLKICYDGICPEKGFTVCVVESQKLDLEVITTDSLFVFKVPKDDTVFDVEYSVKGASVKDMIFSNNTNSLLVSLVSDDKGSLILGIPRALLDAKMDYCPPHQTNPPDDRFFVLLDGEEIPYDEVLTTSEKRVLQIPFTENASKMEIISACLI